MRRDKPTMAERSERMSFVKSAPPKAARAITREQAKDSTRRKRARAQSLPDRTAS